MTEPMAYLFSKSIQSALSDMIAYLFRRMHDNVGVREKIFGNYGRKVLTLSMRLA
jgi:hypothetical protein